MYTVSWTAAALSNLWQQGIYNFEPNKGNNVDDKKAKQSNSQKQFHANFINFMHVLAMNFVKSVSQAKLTGMLLGLFLHRSNFAKNRAITVVGYSLGGHAAFHCMRMLRMLHDGTGDPKPAMILNDMNIYAGCYVIDMTKEYDEIKERS